MNNNQPYDFEHIYREEQAEIEKARAQLDPAAADAPLTGLALSGGGIRSATFNLGVLQGLAERAWLQRIDYLSTVSGGGYIGSWLSALIKRHGDGRINHVQQNIPPTADGKPQFEHPAVSFLRDFSNYLTPKTGLFSGDTLTAVATYLRNLNLNLSILVLGLTLVFLTPRLLHTAGEQLKAWDHLLIPSILLLTASVVMIVRNLAYVRQPESGPPAWSTSFGVLWSIVIPLIVAAWMNSLFIAGNAQELTRQAPLLIVGSAGLYTLLWGTGYVWAAGSLHQSLSAGPWLGKVAGLTFLSGALGGGLFWLLAYAHTRIDPIIDDWASTAFGPPLVIGVFSLIVVFHIGLMGRFFLETQREWWSRLGALLIAVLLLWSGIAAFAIFGPALLIWSNDVVKGILGSGWLLTTIGGVLAAKGSATANSGQHPVQEKLAQYAPYVFITGTFVLLAYVIQRLLGPWKAVPADLCEGEFLCILHQQLQIMNGVPLATLIWATLVVAAATAFLAWRININLFSLHHFYRYRLTRCYLGATNKNRQQHPFTGFDYNDDLDLTGLCQRPYHIVNAAINFVAGGELAWQDRKAASFIFSPRYCGYQMPDSKDPQNFAADRCYYRPTGQYAQAGGRPLSLGTVMAISGAAFAPNMGYHTNPAVAFLLTVFNVRLGRWMGNPTHPESWRKADPAFGLRYIFSELFGFSELDSPFVYISDGGHFENTGVYELVRRRCQHIVVCDAGADPARNFEDLGNAIRKCRTDFGVEIDIDLDPLRAVDHGHHNQSGNNTTCRSKAHHAVGSIDFGPYAPGLKGRIVVLKPSLTQDHNEPVDILHYADSQPAFPQQPTTDQWFDEAQFESYRKLGYYTVTGTSAGDALFDALFSPESEREENAVLTGSAIGTEAAAEIAAAASPTIQD